MEYEKHFVDLRNEHFEVLLEIKSKQTIRRDSSRSQKWMTQMLGYQMGL